MSQAALVKNSRDVHKFVKHTRNMSFLKYNHELHAWHLITWASPAYWGPVHTETVFWNTEMELLKTLSRVDKFENAL